MCRSLYGRDDNPDTSGISDYKCGHQALLAHAAVFRLYDGEFRSSQNGTIFESTTKHLSASTQLSGQVGIALNLNWYEPESYDSVSDMEAARRRFVFENEWLLHPLVEGDYPEMMKHIVKDKSDRQGLERSRLPHFTQEEVRFVKDTLDFLDIDYYSSRKVTVPEKVGNYSPSGRISFDDDVDAVLVDQRGNEEVWVLFNSHN